jgi:hypothetical protein
MIASQHLTKAENSIPANNPLIEYTGRIDFSDPLAPKFSYSGVSIRASFTGTSIMATLSDDLGDNYYNVIINNNVHKVIRVNKERDAYLLAEGLPDTVHEVELFKRTELTFGKTQFHGFTIDKGATLKPLANCREHFIEYIGNSITCGYGNEGQLGKTFGPTTQNHYMSYAAITSRGFNARHMAIARSGIGVYRNYDGPATGNDDCMTNLYSRIFLYDAEPLYSFRMQPDVVCINLGTNDFSTTGGDSTLFTNNYLRLIDTIQAKYQMPTVVCLLGPMLSGDALSKARKYIQEVVDIANNKGKGSVTFFEMSTQTGPVGVDYHPTVAQHIHNAAELTNYLEKLMGWQIYTTIAQ